MIRITSRLVSRFASRNFRLQSDERALAAVRRRYRDRGPWIRQPRFVVLVLAVILAGAFITAGGVSLHDFAQARGSDPELKRLEATHRGADLLIGEVRVLASYERQLIRAAIGIAVERQREIVPPLDEFVTLVTELRDELQKIKIRGIGLGLIEDKMRRLRNAFNQLCRLTKVPCPQPEQQLPGRHLRSPGRGSPARRFSCRK